jgi:hypothetical protein
MRSKSGKAGRGHMWGKGFIGHREELGRPGLPESIWASACGGRDVSTGGGGQGKTVRFGQMPPHMGCGDQCGLVNGVGKSHGDGTGGVANNERRAERCFEGRSKRKDPLAHPMAMFGAGPDVMAGKGSTRKSGRQIVWGI